MMLDAGCWLQVAGCWLQDAGCWMLTNDSRLKTYPAAGRLLTNDSMLSLHEESGQFLQRFLSPGQYCNIFKMYARLIKEFVLQFQGPFVNLAIFEYANCVFYFIGGRTRQ